MLEMRREAVLKQDKEDQIALADEALGKRMLARAFKRSTPSDQTESSDNDMDDTHSGNEVTCCRHDFHHI